MYVRRAKIALGETLAERHVIYLDTRYWILLRKANADLDSTSAVELLGLLRKGIAAGRVFCPISETVFLELMKQSDPVSRLATAALIDELSLGVTLVGQDARIGTEIAYFLRSRSGQTNLHPVKHLIWSKHSYVLGMVHPTNMSFDPEAEFEIQKAVFDLMWTTPLRDIIKTIGNFPTIEIEFRRIAEKLNADVADNACYLQSFEQAYADEARGIVDLFGGIAVDITVSMAFERGAISEQPTPAQCQAFENQHKNLLAVCLEKNKARDELRTLHILSSLHASLRWNKGRKFKGNDLFDFDHAAAALAYGDAFFTEGSLSAMIKERHLALDRAYGCRVTAEMDEAIAITAKLIG